MPEHCIFIQTGKHVRLVEAKRSDVKERDRNNSLKLITGSILATPAPLYLQGAGTRSARSFEHQQHSGQLCEITSADIP